MSRAQGDGRSQWQRDTLDKCLPPTSTSGMQITHTVAVTANEGFPLGARRRTADGTCNETRSTSGEDGMCAARTDPVDALKCNKFGARPTHNIGILHELWRLLHDSAHLLHAHCTLFKLKFDMCRRRCAWHRFDAHSVVHR